ncbi:MAG TPA: hypothetical protein VFF62_10160 [Candidatus Nitrosocosmicus sp.]|jgi:hypothetical protein|nr:hypothetical protein [Candidatus Nitrosocosmicus sp.]
MNGGTGFIPLVIAGVVVLLAIAVVGRLLDLRRRREDEALGLQSRVSDALMLEPGLSGLPVTANMHVPLWPRKPPTLEIVGRVPTPDQHELAARVAMRTLAERAEQVVVEDKVWVDPVMREHAA